MNYESFLSEKGRRIDRRVDLTKGTLAWGIKAKEQQKSDPNFLNATIGSATEDDGNLLISPTFHKEISSLSQNEMFGYANVRGVKAFVDGWKRDTLESFPENLREKADSLSTLPVTVAGGLTSGLAIAGSLFLDHNSVLICPNHRWSNIDNIFFSNKNFTEKTYKLLDEQGDISIKSILAAIKETEREYERIGIYLNFPNNPTGCNPTYEQIVELQEIIKSITTPTVILLDDAYEGYVFDEEGINHSIYPYLIGLNPHVLTIKIDGISKRYTAYGARLGLVTLGFGIEVSQKEKDNARELLAKGARTVASSSPRCFQEALANIFADEPKLQQIKKDNERIYNIIYEKYKLIKKELEGRKSKIFKPVKFTSGFFAYFMVDNNYSANDIAERLLAKGLGTVPSENKKRGVNGIRLAYCSVPTNSIKKAIDILYSIE